MDAFAKELLRVGTLKGFKYFSCYLRGREELLIEIQKVSPSPRQQQHVCITICERQKMRCVLLRKSQAHGRGVTTPRPLTLPPRQAGGQDVHARQRRCKVPRGWRRPCSHCGKLCLPRVNVTSAKVLCECAPPPRGERAALHRRAAARCFQWKRGSLRSHSSLAFKMVGC